MLKWQRPNKLLVIYIHTLSLSLSSRWKFTFYLYIFTYGVRFLKKVRVWGFFFFCLNSNALRPAFMTHIVFKSARTGGGLGERHANIVALNRCWSRPDGVMAWFEKRRNKNKSHHLLYDYTIYYDFVNFVIAAPLCCPQLLFPIGAILCPQRTPAAVALWMKWFKR